MKSAKEMFEELGYKLGETPYYERCIKYVANDGYIKRELEFWLDDKLIYNNLVYGDFQMKGSSPIPMDLLQAINKQVKELKWKVEE